MSLFDLEDRLNWQQAAELLGVSKSAFFRLVERGDITAYGAKEKGRIYLKSECREYLKKVQRKKAEKASRRKSASVSKNL